MYLLNILEFWSNNALSHSFLKNGRVTFRIFATVANSLVKARTFFIGLILP